jgi:threonine dehydratase
MTPAALAAATAEAAVRLADSVVRTPLVPSPWLSQRLGIDVRLKLENVQHTGSFKLRGASNALRLLAPEVAARGVVAASSGNHGLGLAAAAAQLGIPAVVYVPQTTPVEKRAAITAYGVEVIVHGADCVDTEQEARTVAARSGRTYVSPYNDAAVVAGQGTVAVELLAQWPEVDTLYIALGGGGLCAGIAAYARSVRPSIELVACSPQASAAMAACVRAGRVIDVACGETWSDSTAGGVEPGAITLPWCQALVDRFVDVDEPSIAAAMLDCLRHQHLLVEGAAGVAVAGCLQDAARGGRRAAIVVCGGNLPLSRLRALLAG